MIFCIVEQRADSERQAAILRLELDQNLKDDDHRQDWVGAFYQLFKAIFLMALDSSHKCFSVFKMKLWLQDLDEIEIDLGWILSFDSLNNRWYDVSRGQ